MRIEVTTVLAREEIYGEERIELWQVVNIVTLHDRIDGGYTGLFQVCTVILERRSIQVQSRYETSE